MLIRVLLFIALQFLPQSSQAPAQGVLFGVVPNASAHRRLFVNQRTQSCGNLRWACLRLLVRAVQGVQTLA